MFFYRISGLNTHLILLMKHSINCGCDPLFRDNSRSEGNKVPFYLGMATSALPILTDLKYKLLVNRTDVEFVTSDNPVVLYNQLFSFDQTGSNTGWGSKGLQVFFPIGPELGIILFDSYVYSVGNRNKPVVDIELRRDVYQVNRLQMVSALENIYFRDTGQNVESQYRRASGYRRKEKTTLGVYPENLSAKGRSELIQISREDVRIDLTLSFVRLNKRSKKWLRDFRKLLVRPATVVRDQDLIKEHEEFISKVNRGKYRPEDLFSFFNLGNEKANIK